MTRPDIVIKYFHDYKVSDFTQPATLAQISAIEQHFGIILPNDYKEFLLFTNGLASEFGTFDAVEDIPNDTDVCCKEFFAWAIYIGCDGGGEMFVIDRRQQPLQFGLLPYIGDDTDFIPLGDTFDEFVACLYNGTAFNR